MNVRRNIESVSSDEKSSTVNPFGRQTGPFPSIPPLNLSSSSAVTLLFFPLAQCPPSEPELK